MLQGILSCTSNCRVRGHQLAWRYLYQIYALHTRHITTAARRGGGGESCDSGALVQNKISAPFVDQSFTSTHYAADGRRFEFATVIVKAMNKERSPLIVWQHACSLIGSKSIPTFGVAFISKPTVSAKQAIQDFTQQLAFKNEPSADSRISISHDTTILSPSNPSEYGACGAAGVTGEISDGPNQDIPPIIGCIMDDMGDYESCEPGEIQTQTGFTPKKSFMGSRQKRALGSYETPFDDDDEDEATLSDWEGVCSEYLQEAARGNVKLSGKDYGDHEEEEPTTDSSTVSCNEELSNEGLVSFLNSLTKPPQNLCEETAVREDVYNLESSERKAILQNRNLDDGTVPHGLVVSDRGHSLSPVGNSTDEGLASGVVFRGDGGLRRDGGGASPIEIWTRGAKPLVGKESGLENLDENYKLVLCIGHMPGVKAVAFHSSTTGLPRLPDLEEAVTVNNPHMLLLGAPGFVFPDFIQRLSSVFPLSCRAGAFLAPLYTSEKNQWTKVAEKTFSPLFFGTKVATTGVVGLSISSKGKGERVIADAFAELVRMSIAMPRIPGFVFLDEPISTKLFLPKNVAPQHLSLSSGSSYPGQSTLMLDQLSKNLLKRGTVPAVQTSGSDSEKNACSDKETIEAVGLSKGSAVHFSGSREDPQTWNKLPLALFDAVLFPGWSLPFYIFEPCYRAMVRLCVEEGKPFGLSAVYNASWSTDAADQSGEVVGTVANLKVHSFQRDCRSYIIAHGLRRFRVRNERIRAEPGAFGLTVGEVQFFDDKECQNAEEKEELAELAKRTVALCLEVIPEGVTSSTPSLVKAAHDPIAASFAIGHIMDVPTRVKRRWLKLVDTKTRLLEQIAFFETKASSVSS